MPASLLDGRALAERVKSDLAERVEQLREKSGGRRPGLAVVLAGDDPASEVYVRNKGRAAERVGMHSETIRLDAATSTEKLLQSVRELNAREDIHGFLVQLPLPDGIDQDKVLDTIDPAKDADGFHPINVGNLMLGRAGFVPCTPAGIMALLDSHDVPLEGREAVVIGRSNIVGKPLALLLLRRHATVTLCHSRTRDLEQVAKRADLVVAAMGRPGFVTDRHVKPGAVVVDVGINRVESAAEARDYFADQPKRLEQFEKKGYTLVGDVHPARVRAVAGALSPVPGGVGPLTIAFLLQNTVDGFERSL